MRIALMGPQASGKGTQAKKLIQKYGLVHISPGMLLRHEVEQKTGLGKKIEKIIDAGDLVPNEIIFDLIHPLLEKNENVLFDGFPRSLEQAEILDKSFQMDKVILIVVPDSVSKERIGGRRECDDGHDYHIKYKPPKKDGICDIDGKKLHKRHDDTPKAIQHRLDIYHSQTEPVIEFYKKQGIVIQINGDQPIEAVTKEIMSKL
jgi:adenylate kinase